jgi:type VI secretion system protein ImpH
MSDELAIEVDEGSDDLPGRLLSRGWLFDFFQAVWLLERHGGSSGSVGGRGPLAQETIRFRPHVSLGFPPTDVRSIRALPSAGEAPRYQFDVTFLGLYGASTPLPLHYAVDLLRAVEQYEPPAPGDTARAGTPAPPAAESCPTRDFLDIFHHRVLSLFYRAWTKYRYDVTFGMLERDAITDYLRWAIGCSPDWDESVLGLSPIRLIRYAGVLTQHPRSAVTLEGVLTDYWEEIDFAVEPFHGRWVTLPEEDMNRIGSANCAPGHDLTVGEQVYDLSGAFSVSVGPVDWATYLSFLPDGQRFAQTRCLVELFCADPLAFTFEVRIQAGQVPELQLTSGDDAGRLGYTSWVRTDELDETAVLFDATIGNVEFTRNG